MAIDPVERDRAASVAPVAGRGALVIEGVLRFAIDAADEGQRRLVLAACRVPKIDLRGAGMVGDHAAERVGRYAADKPCRRAETRHADGDVETGTSERRHDGVAPRSSCRARE